ncbi:MAG TPA: sigma-70 family RNA polymerase sigma factor [Candidatus Aphodoplasma excrementigallinarum]|uniref:Sigma-70 family RNA polymerase sigma factor n=1 Tax=Candidatus Aphodoplasma excrementigallinarum TaxID=2840673 RepID=A0A9D1NFL1_9FIRM|nr:sigma-70 family RNA polymerase sigma factor [Candidatus Aphodoplasma excrementigallinarum]
MGEKQSVERASDAELFLQYQKTKDTAVRNEIIARYTYLAQIMARRFSGRGIDYDDLYQVACIGLLYAVERFDVSKDLKFTTFATPTIAGEIKRYFRDKGNFIRVPRRLYEIFSKAHRIRLANTGEPAQEKTGEPLPQVISIEREILGSDAVRFEHTLGRTDDGFLMVEDKDFVENCMKELSGQEREFIQKRYYGEQSQKQIAASMGVSQMCISRLERKLLKKLRDMYFKEA